MVDRAQHVQGHVADVVGVKGGLVGHPRHHHVGIPDGLHLPHTTNMGYSLCQCCIALRHVRQQAHKGKQSPSHPASQAPHYMWNIRTTLLFISLSCKGQDWSQKVPDQLPDILVAQSKAEKKILSKILRLKNKQKKHPSCVICQRSIGSTEAGTINLKQIFSELFHLIANGWLCHF